MKETKCDCGAIIWCYKEGYRIKPPRPKRPRPSARVKEIFLAGSDQQQSTQQAICFQ